MKNVRVLNEFRKIYGNKFDRLYKNEIDILEAQDKWSKCLKEFDDEVIDKAISLSPSRFQWPPNLKEFMDLCKSLDKKDFGIKNNYSVSNSQDENVKRIIDEGAVVCKRLKQIYPNKSWMEVASLFSKLKAFQRSLHKDDSTLEIILVLQEVDNDYYKDVLGDL